MRESDEDRQARIERLVEDLDAQTKELHRLSAQADAPSPMPRKPT